MDDSMLCRSLSILEFGENLFGEKALSTTSRTGDPELFFAGVVGKPMLHFGPVKDPTAGSPGGLLALGMTME
jgi:hypothetical protein